MNKKLIAVAVAGALGVPAMAQAQSSTVQIGGSITTFYYKHSPKNPGSNQSGDILEPSEPELYVHGEEKLGGGLSAWFRCTSQLDGMLGGGPASTGSGFCNRNSGIGLKGSFGNIFQGNWDDPTRLATYNRARGWFGGTNSFTGGLGRLLFGGAPSGVPNPVQSTSGFFSAAGSGITTTSTNTPSGFARRAAQTWNYHSPSWNGFSVVAQYSADNEATGRPEASVLNPRLYNLGANYVSGPLTLGAAFAKHKDFNPGNVAVGAVAGTYAGGTDDNWSLMAGYRFGPVNARAIYSKSDYEVAIGHDMKVKGFGLYADWALQGPHTLRGQYVKLDDISGTSALPVSTYRGPTQLSCGPTSVVACASGTGAKVWSLVYSYAFSKRTEGSIAYTKLDNDGSAAHTLGKSSVSVGNSQTSTGIVLKHRF